MHITFAPALNPNEPPPARGRRDVEANFGFDAGKNSLDVDHLVAVDALFDALDRGTAEDSLRAKSLSTKCLASLTRASGLTTRRSYGS